MNRLAKLRLASPGLEALARETLDKGLIDFEHVKREAQEIFILTGDLAVKNYTYPRLSLRKLWNLRKVVYEAGPYKGKKIFHSRDTSKHIVAVLRAQGYNIKFPNNLDFIYNLLTKHDITSFFEFSSIITSRSPDYFNSYAQTQIDAMLEYGHLG